jgi:3-methyladenine DNA glycosylase AlkC
MAELLKNVFNPAFVEALANRCAQYDTGFSPVHFSKAVLDADWEKRALKERMRHISHCLQTHLQGEYAAQLAVLLQVGPYFKGLSALVFPDFVALAGLDEAERSIDALARFTPLCTSEFGIRPFLIRYPDACMAAVHRWATAPDEHLRRLASEGIRPRLPWGQDVPWIKKNPEAVLPVLEKLKNDTSAYVRRSVANNLNDITKSKPELVLQLAAAWMQVSDETAKLLKHALRGLLKKGDPTALALFAYTPAHCTIDTLSLSASQIPLGGNCTLLLELTHQGNEKAAYRIDYAIQFARPGNKESRKVFRGPEKVLASGERLQFKRKLNFVDLSTRKHYPGLHHLTILVNGENMGTCSFMLMPA